MLVALPHPAKEVAFSLPDRQQTRALESYSQFLQGHRTGRAGVSPTLLVLPQT